MTPQNCSRTIFLFWARLICCLIICEPLTGSRGVCAAAAGAPSSGAAAIAAAVSLAASGNDSQALGPLRLALTTDSREDPVGWETLGIVCLRDGYPDLAERAFGRAAAFAMPGDALPEFGAAMAAVAQRHGDAAAIAALADPNGDFGSAADGPVRDAARDLAMYALLLNGDATAARNATASVNADEPDAVLLEVAGFAALRGGEPARGVTLLRALLARPDLAGFEEEPANVLTFLDGDPIEGVAGQTVTGLDVPNPPRKAEVLSGEVTLAPPANLPDGVSYISYALEGGAFAASTNEEPYVLDWDTSALPNGSYLLHTVAFSVSRHVLMETRRYIRLANANAAPDGSGLSQAEGAALRARLWTLLVPRACRKAAHFALAERAAATGNHRTELAELESVCAIDPTYRSSFALLRRFYREVLGPRAGIWRANTQEKIVALTFDDGPNPLPYRTPALLDALKAAGAHATFFVVGQRAEVSPFLVERMHDEGHEVANHSYSHLNLALMNQTDIERDLCRTSVVVRDTIGIRPRFYRPPGGNFNTLVVDSAEALGMSGAYWTVDGFTIEQIPDATPDDLTRFVLDRVRPGAIILLHNAPRVTVAAVPAIVQGLRDRGYTLLTMSELVQRARKSEQIPPSSVVGTSHIE